MTVRKMVAILRDYGLDYLSAFLGACYFTWFAAGYATEVPALAQLAAIIGIPFFRKWLRDGEELVKIIQSLIDEYKNRVESGDRSTPVETQKPVMQLPSTPDIQAIRDAAYREGFKSGQSAIQPQSVPSPSIPVAPVIPPIVEQPSGSVILSLLFPFALALLLIPGCMKVDNYRPDPDIPDNDSSYPFVNEFFRNYESRIRSEWKRLASDLKSGKYQTQVQYMEALSQQQKTILRDEGGKFELSIEKYLSKSDQFNPQVDAVVWDVASGRGAL